MSLFIAFPEVDTLALGLALISVRFFSSFGVYYRVAQTRTIEVRLGPGIVVCFCLYPTFRLTLNSVYSG